MYAQFKVKAELLRKKAKIKESMLRRRFIYSMYRIVEEARRLD